jgi:hypothetical protein
MGSLQFNWVSLNVLQDLKLQAPCHNHIQVDLQAGFKLEVTRYGCSHRHCLVLNNYVRERRKGVEHEKQILLYRHRNCDARFISRSSLWDSSGAKCSA